MSFNLPLANSKQRAEMDINHIALVLNPDNRSKLPSFREALTTSRDFLKKDSAAKSLNVLCLRATGDYWMIKVTNKTWHKVWNFGSSH